MYKAFKFRLNLNQKQEIVMKKHVGSVRFVYNHFLAKRKKYYEDWGDSISTSICSSELPDLKIEHPWLNEIEATCLQQALRDQETAYKNFFRGSGFPKFKSKHKDKSSFRVMNMRNTVRIQGDRIRLNKIGFVKLYRAKNQLQRLPSDYKVMSATISKDSDQHWYVSVLVECENQAPYAPLDSIIGIDLGIKNNYEVCTKDGFAGGTNPKALANELKRLKRLSRRHSRKEKGSKNREKARVRLAKKHFRIKSIRSDYNHQISKYLIDNYQVIVIEDLDLDQMKQNHMGKQISDLAFYQFRLFLAYKAQWYGRDLIIVSRYFASTKICSDCGHHNHNLTLKDRSWICPKCHVCHDRDENAAKNLYQVGIYFWNTGIILDSVSYCNLFN